LISTEVLKYIQKDFDERTSSDYNAITLTNKHLEKLEVYLFASPAAEVRTCGGRIHVENFANQSDLVALLGVLSPQLRGKPHAANPNWVFIRNRNGHLLNENYLRDFDFDAFPYRPLLSGNTNRSKLEAQMHQAIETLPTPPLIPEVPPTAEKTEIRLPVSAPPPIEIEPAHQSLVNTSDKKEEVEAEEDEIAPLESIDDNTQIEEEIDTKADDNNKTEEDEKEAPETVSSHLEDATEVKEAEEHVPVNNHLADITGNSDNVPDVVETPNGVDAVVNGNHVEEEAATTLATSDIDEVTPVVENEDKSMLSDATKKKKKKKRATKGAAGIAHLTA